LRTVFFVVDVSAIFDVLVFVYIERLKTPTTKTSGRLFLIFGFEEMQALYMHAYNVSPKTWPYSMRTVTVCLRRILRIPYTDRVTNADVRLRAGSLPQLLPLIQTRRLRFFGHVARMGDSRDLFRALHTSIRGLPKDWRRHPGRPRHTWLRTLEADLQPLNHKLNSAWRHAQDRRRRKQLVKTATIQSGAYWR